MKSILPTATFKKLRELFAKHGLPAALVRTNGGNCSSLEFKEFIKRNWCIRHIKVPPYHPCTNGLAEKAITCKNQVPYNRHYVIRTIVRGKGRDPFSRKNFNNHSKQQNSRNSIIACMISQHLFLSVTLYKWKMKGKYTYTKTELVPRTLTQGPVLNLNFQTHFKIIHRRES